MPSTEKVQLLEDAIAQRVHKEKFQVMNDQIEDFIRKDDFRTFRIKTEETMAEIFKKFRPLATHTSVKSKVDKV